MKCVFQMWAISVCAVASSAVFDWNPFLVFIAGVIFGAAVVMSAIEVQDNA